MLALIPYLRPNFNLDRPEPSKELTQHVQINKLYRSKARPLPVIYAFGAIAPNCNMFFTVSGDHLSPSDLAAAGCSHVRTLGGLCVCFLKF